MANTAHKSATSVTLAPLQEKSQFELFVQQYWRHAAVAAIAVAGAVVVLHQRSQAERLERAKSWDALVARTTVDPFTRELQADDATWSALALELKGKDSGPWARLFQAKKLLDERKYDEARAAIGQLRAEYPQHPLVVDSLRWSDDDKGASLLQTIEQRLSQRGAWEGARPELFGHPKPDASDPRIVFKTSKGDIEVALYQSKAPQHVAKFLELVAAQYFDGMAFHGVAAGQSASIGDPNTKSDDTSTWGQGGRDIVLPFETSGLHHFEGALSAEEGANPKESLGSRFSFIVADSLLEDDSRVVFGSIQSGLDVARQIAAAETDPSAPGRPKEPIRILSAQRQ